MKYGRPVAAAVACVFLAVCGLNYTASGKTLLRSINAAAGKYLYMKTDAHGIYSRDNVLYQRAETVDTEKVASAAAFFVNIREKYFPDSDAFMVTVPDKTSYQPENAGFGFPAFDSEGLTKMLAADLDTIHTIPVADLLSVTDYYRTDLHWRQEAITDVAARILGRMKEEAGDETDESTIEGVAESVLQNLQPTLVLSDYRGAYSRLSSLPTDGEAMYCMTGTLTENAVVYDYEKGGAETAVYNYEKLQGEEAYDIYLSGARAMLKIASPDVSNGKVLVMCRDSFGSSLAPYFIGAYEEIWLLDFRYLSPSLITSYIDVKDGREYTLLYVYGCELLNHSDAFAYIL